MQLLHSKIRNINFSYEQVVVGSSLESLLYSFLNNIPFVFTKLERPNRFDCFNPDVDLSVFGLENKTKILIEKDILWEKLYFYLTLSGLNPMADKTVSLKIQDKTIKAFTDKARMAKIEFRKLIVFSDEGVLGLPPPTHFPEKKYKVYDWFNVRSGMKHDYDRIEDTSNFVNYILFYPTDRIDGEQALKDAVSISYLSEKELDLFEYSDINARFKTLKMMKEAGIRGARNGRDMNDKTKYKYYAVRIENSHREKELLTFPVYESTSTIKFNNDTFDGIMEKNKLSDSYVSRILQ